MSARPCTTGAFLFLTLAAFACGGGGSGADQTKADAKRADANKADANKADANKPDETKTADPPPASADAACGTYVTEADIEQACGVAVQGEVTRGEGNHPLNTCSRKFRGPDDRSISFKLAVHESVAKVSSIPWKDGATGIPDLGDAAHAYVEDKGGQFDWHTVEVRSGDRILYLRSINATGAEPLCSTEKLTEVARAASGRLASSG